MRTVCIVSHCWRYSKCLNYQLSSLLLHPPKRVQTSIWVFACKEDEATCRVIKFFQDEWSKRWGTDTTPAPVWIHPVWLPRAQLLNRSIGRNHAAENGDCFDAFWFTDADYLFRDGALDALADVDLESSRLFFPRETWFTKDRETGDAYADRATEPAVLDVDPADFIEHAPGKAIGGIQIVPGKVAKQFGYCRDVPQDQRPLADDCTTFKRNFSDTRFRKSLGCGRGTRIDVPGVYRIRQTEFGVVYQK